MTTYRQELRGLIPLAVPLALTHLGQNLLGAVDTAVVGRLGELELGATGLAHGVYFTITVLGLGIVAGLDPLISQAVGANEHERSRRLLWQGTWLSAILFLPLAGIIAALGLNIEAFGIAPDTGALVREYLWARLPGLLPFLVFTGARSFLQAYSVTRPMVIGVVAANVLNLPMSWLLVFGDDGLARLGLPEIGLSGLGVAGAGWTSTACALLQLVIILAGTRSIDRTPGLTGHRGPAPELIKQAAALGFPIGFAMLAEVGIFSLTNVLMGNIGPRALAGHQVAITVASASFMIPLGIGAAASVRVGNAIGRQDQRGARVAGFAGLMAGLAFTSCSLMAFIFVPELFASLVTDKEPVIALAVRLILIAGVFQLVDGSQAIAFGALRGAGDTRLPFILCLVGYYVIGVPTGVLLCFPAGLGPEGLWWGLCAGLSAVGIALSYRFHRLSLRPIKRV